MNKFYILVEWPDIQYFMEQEWFRNEAVLVQHENIGDSTYFIPIKRYQEFTGKSLVFVHLPHESV